ncbi:hypothetical protein LBK6_10830 [Leptospira borgpetersenii serovar Hardjo]|nr:hypothetical protein LBK6_10830 [Leptospira borgpetersenii serovar Hardjo]AMX62061.1 hypothetical protein LBK9_10870 [Leptospira borgpetersenii serovar Hardjo]AMX65304.1 hypothetical protein LBK30_10890 [Leptospira borgpetersenii serovar Hardjo]AMX68514.1 hypothetical protein LBHA_10725 [Leptospira borgpetersenii serovar Hardjo]AMX70734.1 hypothetical protein LBHB_05310 [Leptospira borgpetersenii serovar Hardjo]
MEFCRRYDRICAGLFNFTTTEFSVRRNFPFSLAIPESPRITVPPCLGPIERIPCFFVESLPFFSPEDVKFRIVLLGLKRRIEDAG